MNKIKSHAYLGSQEAVPSSKRNTKKVIISTIRTLSNYANNVTNNSQIQNNFTTKHKTKKISR